jgi:hypothetical protein
MELTAVRYRHVERVLVAAATKHDSLGDGRDPIVIDGNILLRSHDRENISTMAKNLRTWLLGLVVLALMGSLALGQNLSQPLSPGGPTQRHKGPTGQPCLAFTSSAKSQAVNKNIYEHWISATNSCGQNIKVQVCYYNTDDCIMMNIPPWERKDAVLGIYPNLRDFRYETKEQF